MVEAGQRNMTIDLHIKSVSLKVTENTAVCVFWQRGKLSLDIKLVGVERLILNVGAKKANTKSRLLNENVSQAIIDEKFQITTIMEVNSEGVPVKDKMVLFYHLNSTVKTDSLQRQGQANTRRGRLESERLH